MLARRRAVALVGLYGCVVLAACVCVAAWPGALTGGDTCPSSEWSAMCRPCCEYQLIRCRCPSKGSRVGYTVPCCRNALDQCDPCIVHPGCSLFENCKTCHNGTWKANDDFFVNGKYCTECRSGWSGGDCKACGGVVQRPQGHVALEGYPTNARCEWTVRVERGHAIELRFTLLSLESDPSCRYDYVEVRDGDDLSSPVIGRFCGAQLPPRMNSSGSHLHILFISDGYNNFDGFVFTFQQTSGTRSPACPPPQQPVHGYVLPTYGPKEELESVTYGCHPPFALSGSQQRTCLNGTWSGTEPACVQGQPSRVQCPPLKLLNGYQRPAVDAAGGAEAVEFVCKKPYVLDGQHQSTCLSDGSWSSRPPKCVRASLWMKLDGWREDAAVFSFLPLPGSHSLRLYVFRFTTQDLLSAGFLPLTLARKSDVERGEAAAEKLPRGFHRVYTSIEYRCASPLFRHTGSPRRTCLRTGRWSGRHVSCSPVCGKFNTFSARGLSDAPWPWHAAVYVRSAGTQRPRGAAVSHQQGPSEESARWRLACSGALLGQRSVLVTAECVADKVEQRPLHPAHVKVVIGPQHQTPKDALKGLRQLRVSDILVHPRFYSAPGSSVAVLKLQDKAKISQRVLPVCLHTMGEVTTQRAYVSRWILTNNHGHLSRFAPSSHTELVQLSDVAQCERESARGGANSTVTGDNSLCVVSRPSRPRSSCPGVIPGLTVAPATSSPAADALWGHTETQEASESSWQLLGLETFSYEETNCHKQTHTLQTRVAHFQAWIEKSMK